MEIKNVFVTGGGGFLGKVIVRKLLEKSFEVSSFSRGFYPELEKLGVRQVEGDLSDRQSVVRAFKGIDAVFHVAAKTPFAGTFKEFYTANVTGTRHVIAACMENRVSQLIFTSTPSVVFNDGDMENADESVPYAQTFLSPYPETKAMAERMVREASGKGLATISIRPHLIWGPEDNNIVPGILQRAKSLKRVGRKDDLVDTIYVDNAADAHVWASEKLAQNPSLSGNVYFVSQDEPVSKWAMANAFLYAAGLPPIKGHVSERSAYIAGAVFETIYKVLKLKKDPPMTRYAAKELATSHWFNISRAKKELGYYPRVSTQEGLKRLKKWLSTSGYNNS